jgi:DNA-binding transcriptional MocR family regulator
MVAPPSALGALQRAKSVADLGTPHLSQHVAAKLLRMAPEIDAERRATAQRRLHVLSRELRERLPSWEWTEPTGGLSLWVRLPGADAKRYAQLALRAGAAVLPGPLLSAPGYFTDRIRVSYHLPEEQLVEGARRLAAAWDMYHRQRPIHHVHHEEGRDDFNKSR